METNIEVINPESLGIPRGYNHGIKARGQSFLFVAGQVAWDREGKLVGGDDLVAQFDKALENLLAVVAQAGGRPENVVKMNLYVLDKEEYRKHLKALGQVYRKHMGKHFPAITLVEVRGLFEEGTRIEVEAMAVL